MKPLLRLSRRARWAVPGGVVAVTAAVTAGSMLTVAQASPELPVRSPAQLLAAVAGHTGAPPAMTGTVVETASLGIPALPDVGTPTSITSLLAGSHTMKVWYADPTHIRLAVPVTLSETDLIRNGSTVWLWQSQSNAATRMQLPAKAGQAEPTPVPSQTPLTPEQAAQQVLAAVGPTTTVSVDPAARVAGRAAYQLVLAPKSSGSLIRRVTIALDGQHTDVPLRVQVFARGAKSPAVQISYTSIAFVKPAAANFRFTPPPGAKVSTQAPPSAQVSPGGQTGWSGYAPRQQAQHAASTVIGKDWLSVAVFPASALPAIAGPGNAASVAGQAAQNVAGSPGAGSGAGIDGGALLGALLHSASPVKGTWGSGRLLHTKLVSVLVTDSGKVLVGAVTPTVLYNAAAQAK
jgi:outer membrane lipoprotein-sorting protein